jgi:hypothetical protein
VDRLKRAATPAPGGGVAYRASDVLYGNAGVILTLLALRGDPPRRLAVALGEGLLGRAQATPHGKRWLMYPDERASYLTSRTAPAAWRSHRRGSTRPPATAATSTPRSPGHSTCCRSHAPRATAA